jgi:ectoine hydroxylase-related dioxygenase (phytanoyl-CoA dioxygenase family)
MLLFKEKISYKLANGGSFHAHLDAPAYEHVGKIDHLTAILAVDKATMENGCLEVVPTRWKSSSLLGTTSHQDGRAFMNGSRFHSILDISWYLEAILPIDQAQIRHLGVYRWCNYVTYRGV